MLPRQSGFDVLRDLRQQGVDTPVIMLDGSGKFLHSWGDKKMFPRAHGITIGPDDSVADAAKLNRVGRFAPAVCSADGLEAILIDYFGIPVEVRQYSGAWLDIPPELRSRLGDQRLGMESTLGGSTWQCQHKFEIVLGPLASGALSNSPGSFGTVSARHCIIPNSPCSNGIAPRSPIGL